MHEEPNGEKKGLEDFFLILDRRISFFTKRYGR